jgi:uncharacterized protein YaeQ
MPAQSFFHSFDLTLSDAERSIFIETRLRLSRSISEPMDRIFAKVLAYCHAYEPDLIFSNGQDVQEPAIFRKNLTGDYTDWFDIGCPSHKKLNRVVRSHSKPNIRLYFFRGGHQAEFSREHRGLELEYARRLTLFEFDPNVIAALGNEDSRHLVWNVTLMEGGMYLDNGKQTFESVIPQLNTLNLVTGGTNDIAQGLD